LTARKIGRRLWRRAKSGLSTGTAPVPTIVYIYGMADLYIIFHLPYGFLGCFGGVSSLALSLQGRFLFWKRSSNALSEALLMRGLRPSAPGLHQKIYGISGYVKGAWN
jgi:hypothetical protein